MGKAVAAAISGLPSDRSMERFQRFGSRPVSYCNVVPPRRQRGGLPILERGVVQGGCGVSGAATAELDEECARVGIAAIHESMTKSAHVPMERDVLVERGGIQEIAEYNILTNVEPPSGEPEGRAAEQSARAAQRLSLLGEMTGGIAHDFRNILTVIDSCLRLAERNISDPDKMRALVAGTRGGVDRGLRLISQLVTFARQNELHTSAADINALLANLELFLQYAAGSSIRIDFEPSADLPKCLVDPSQFAAAILNLVINARDAMPRGGIVRLTTTRRDPEANTPEGEGAGNYVRVRVKDNGLGMTEDVMKKMFEPFFTTKGKMGTGLGIPQVCAFIHQIRGRFKVDSEVGRGTTFDLFLPALEDEENAPHLEAA